MFVHRDFNSEQAFDVDDASVQWITRHITVESASYQFTNLTHLHLLAPITYEDEWLGSIYIQSGLGKLYRNLFWESIIALIAVILAGSVAYLLSSRLQRLTQHVIEPIDQCTDLVVCVVIAA